MIFAIIFFVSLITILFIKKYLYQYFLDIPNHRSLHNKNIPRIGGLAIFLSFFTGLFLENNSNFLTYLIPILPIVIIGLIDDIKPVNFLLKLLFQVCSALILINQFNLDQFYFSFYFIFIMVYINAFNFMDGVDEFSGRYYFYTLICFTAILFCFNKFSNEIAYLIFALLPFMYFNKHKARIFLGDLGSLVLPFIVFALLMNDDELRFVLISYLGIVNLPLFVDVAFTLFRRLRNGKDIFSAHREHFYQDLYLRKYSPGFISTLYIVHSLILVCIYSLIMLYSNIFLSSCLVTCISFILYYLLKNFYKKKP